MLRGVSMRRTDWADAQLVIQRKLLSKWLDTGEKKWMKIMVSHPGASHQPDLISSFRYTAPKAKLPQAIWYFIYLQTRRALTAL